jgi:hypothetical protein
MYHDILFLNKTEKVVILDLVYKIFGKNNMPDIKWPLKCISPFSGSNNKFTIYRQSGFNYKKAHRADGLFAMLFCI